MSNVLIGLFGFLALLFWGMLFFGDSPFYILHAWGFTFLTGLVAVFSEDSSGSYNSDDSSSYYYHQQNEENSSDYDDDDDIRQNRWDDDDDRIYNSHGDMVNGKLKEYYRNVEKTGIADTEYELELKDGYRYCDDHEDYDDCHYGRDD